MILPHEIKPPVWVQVIEGLVYRQICPSVDVAHEIKPPVWVQVIEELVAPVLALAVAAVAYLVVDSLYLTMLMM